MIKIIKIIENLVYEKKSHTKYFTKEHYLKNIIHREMCSSTCYKEHLLKIFHFLQNFS